MQQEVVRNEDGSFSLGKLNIIPVSISSISGRNNFQPTPLAETDKAYARVLSKLDGTFNGPNLKVDYGDKETEPPETQAPTEGTTPTEPSSGGATEAPSGGNTGATQPPSGGESGNTGSESGGDSSGSSSGSDAGSGSESGSGSSSGSDSGSGSGGESGGSSGDSGGSSEGSSGSGGDNTPAEP